MASIVKKIIHPKGEHVKLGHYKVGPVGTGLMNLTWRPQPSTDEQAFAVLNAALEGGSNFWNTGTFYGNPPNLTAGLQLLSRYFAAHPGVSPKVVLSVKGCNTLVDGHLAFDATPAGLDKSIKEAIEALGTAHAEERSKAGLPVIDLFESARVPRDLPVEVTVRALKKYIDEGTLGGYCLSESSADTIRRAHAVHPPSGVEVEYSLWATEIETNGIIAACKELDVPVIAYSPVGRGFLTGGIRSLDDIPEGDFRRSIDRFQPENFNKNLELVDKVTAIAKQKGVSAAQLGIGWVVARGKAQGAVVIPIPGSTKVEQTKENIDVVSLSKDELKSIDEILTSIKPVGGRYSDGMAKMMNLNGDTISESEYASKQAGSAAA